MMIELKFDDLAELVETARLNGSSIMFLTRSTDNKRCTIVVVHEPRRKHRASRAAAKTQADPKP